MPVTNRYATMRVDVKTQAFVLLLFRICNVLSNEIAFASWSLRGTKQPSTGYTC